MNNKQLLDEAECGMKSYPVQGGYYLRNPKVKYTDELPYILF